MKMIKLRIMFQVSKVRVNDSDKDDDIDEDDDNDNDNDEEDFSGVQSAGGQCAMRSAPRARSMRPSATSLRSGEYSTVQLILYSTVTVKVFSYLCTVEYKCTEPVSFVQYRPLYSTGQLYRTSYLSVTIFS